MKDFRGPPKSAAKKERKPGEVPDNRIPIYDHAGNVRGHVTHAATQATVARFLGRHGADLTTKDGRQAWVGHKPPPPPPPPDIIIQGGDGPGSGKAIGDAKPSDGKLPQSTKSKVKDNGLQS